jgi:hypothetical protein
LNLKEHDDEEEFKHDIDIENTLKSWNEEEMLKLIQEIER